MLVSIGVIILRRTRPDLPRAFRVPFSPVLPALAVLACLFLTLNLTGETWLRFAIWMLVGFVVYFAYSARHSRLAPGGDHTPVQDTATSRTESPRTA
jgi:APA family basic amino acid/polyamine antiporter